MAIGLENNRVGESVRVYTWLELQGFGNLLWRDYGDLSRNSLLPTVAGTVTEIWPALVTVDCATGDQEFGSKRFVFS
jgi:hypothetical protein